MRLNTQIKFLNYTNTSILKVYYDETFNSNKESIAMV